MSLPTRVSRSSQHEPFETAQREFDTMLNRFFGNREVGATWTAPYAVDVREDGDHLYVEAELPGFRKEDVDITLENQTLTITAERKSESAQGDGNGKEGQWLLNERRYHRFQRSFMLPPTINEQTVQAKLNDGVLSVVLNKREETKPRKVQVS